MKIEALKKAERDFLARYPGGFENEEMIVISKKHKPEKMYQFAQNAFAPEQFVFEGQILENLVKIVGQSSMISVFEKPKFRDFIKLLNQDERSLLVRGLEQLLHGDQSLGFRWMLEILSIGKLAKWTILTICLFYYKPQEEVFIKPTTTKFILQNFELAGLYYSPKPDYSFYTAYRDEIMKMKQLVHPSLSPSNAAFTAFLMLGML